MKQTNNFVETGLKESAITVSENGAKKYKTTNNPFVDQFASISNYLLARDFKEVEKDMHLLWSLDPNNCIRLAIYIRLITRETEVFSDKKSFTLEVQNGSGMKTEGLLRMYWLGVYHKKSFFKNLALFIAAGSWKDVFDIMVFDLEMNGWNKRRLDWNGMKEVIFAGLINERSHGLVKKYLPSIRNNKDCNTSTSKARNQLAKFLAKNIFGADEEPEKFRAFTLYRHLKNSGNAHEWQKLISQGKFFQVDFNSIAGKALRLLVGSKFLKNQGLEEKYRNWIKSKKTVKYTGFVHELFAPYGNRNYPNLIEEYVEDTINAQFETLIEVGAKEIGNVNEFLVVRDISSSMLRPVPGTNTNAFIVAKAMALYFSELLTGYFHNSYAAFSRTTELFKWIGNTPVEKWKNDTDTFFSQNTNLSSVADFLVRVLKRGVQENEFPKGLLIISDGEFDYVGRDKTNFEVFREILKEGGFSEEFATNLKLVMWDITSGKKTKFEDFADAPNIFHISGFDGSVIKFLVEGKEMKRAPKNSSELFNAAMQQQLMNLVEV